ncbi:glycosyltransferase family 1 protein [Deltaproteobacteria bacterium TL4]
MRIAIDIRVLLVSGMGTYLQNILPILIEKKSDVQFYLLGHEEEIMRFSWAQNQNVSIIDMHSTFYSIKEQFELIKKIPKNIHLFWSAHYNIPLFYTGKLFVTVYDVLHLAMPQYAPGLHKKAYAKLMFSSIRRKAEAITTISQFTADELIRLTGKGNQEIYPILLGVNQRWFELKPEVTPHKNPFLLYVGNVKPHKNLIALLNAFEGITDQIPHDLVIIGKKEGFITGDERIFKKTQSLGHRLIFTGYIEQSQLEQYFLNAEALVFPTKYEGFGLPPLEAMACGCPVITSNAASLSEVCGDAAVYFDPDDSNDIAEKIKFVLNDSSLRENLIQKGKAQAQLFRWEKTAEQTWSVIQDIIEQDG